MLQARDAETPDELGAPGAEQLYQTEQFCMFQEAKYQPCTTILQYDPVQIPKVTPPSYLPWSSEVLPPSL